MSDLGKAYVQIVASAEGISDSITNVLEPEANKAGKSAGTTIATQAGGAISKAGGAMTLGLTAPIAAIGGASIAAFNEMHGGLETIIQKTGATGDALDGMREVLDGVVSDIPVGFDEAGSAIGEVNTRFGATGDELQALSEQFLKFADLNGTDVSGSIDAVQSAMAAFGLEASDTSAFLDTLNKAGQNTGVNVDQLAQSMTSNATALQELGYNASDAATFLSQLGMSGIDSATVMTGMRRAMADAAKNGKSMSEAMGDLQESIVNADSETEAYQLAVETFGTKAGPAIAKAVREGRLSFDALGTSLEDNVGNVSETFEATLTPMDTFKTSMNEIKTVGADLGSILFSALAPVLEKVAELIHGLVDGWNSLSPGMQNAIVTVAGILAVLGPVLSIGGKIMGLVGTLGPVVGALTNPIGLVVAAIGGAIAIGVALYQNWDTVKERAGQVWGVIQEKFGAISGKVSEVWESIKTWTSDTWETAKTTVSNAMQTAQTTATTAIEGLKTTASNAWDTVKETTSTAWENAKTSISTAAENAQSAAETAIDAIGTTLSSVWGTVSETTSTTWESVKTSVSTSIGNAQTAAATALDSIGTKLSGVWESAKQKTSDVWKGIRTSVSEGAGFAWTSVTTIFGNIKTKIETVMNNAKTAVSNAIEAMKRKFNFSWSLPKIKLPHISITGSFSLNPPSAPHFSISWYKQGAIFGNPAVIGVGEAGPEAVVPLSGQQMRPFAKAIAAEMGGSGANVTMNISVSGAENPEEFAVRLARRLKLELRTVG